MKYNLSNYCAPCLLGGALFLTMLFSCGKMNSNYADFVKNGEIVYSGRPDSLTAFSGDNRVLLRWMLVSDPKIVQCKVFWNNKTDSLVIPVTRSAGVDTINAMVNKLPEGLYAFQVFAYDGVGHSSVKSEVTAASYGDTYAQSIFNRSLKGVTKSKDGKTVYLSWFGAGQQAVVVELQYTNSTDQLVTLYLKGLLSERGNPIGFATADTITGYKPGTSFKFRTGFAPTKTAIDTFYTDYKTVTP
ncbi:DUF4998 domain-containing protein [Niabella soli]|uniref:DUF4998 domain-containing protein n=1 Tax=Niabella soli TaxID=446683 RepID=UPI0002499100|nr:DUF4998 domain-containing protein [Niabella soli]